MLNARETETHPMCRCYMVALPISASFGFWSVVCRRVCLIENAVVTQPAGHAT